MMLLGRERIRRIRQVAVVLGLAAMLIAAGAAAASDRDRRQGGDPRSKVPVFVLEKGRFAVFDAPGTGANELADINDRGQVAGTYIDAAGANRGFVRDGRGRLTVFSVPGANQSYVVKINDRGQVAGNACDADPCDSPRGYLRDAKGRFTTIRVPDSVSTQALGLDDRGRVVGDFVDADGGDHGYLWEEGRFTTIDVPGATLTQVTAINDRGEIVGVYLDAAGNPHGFFRSTRGRISTIDAPDVRFTLPFDIDDRGQIVGFTTTALPLPDADEVHGFLLKDGPGGRFVRIDVPGAPRTLASGIDDRGRIVGLYENPNSTSLDALRLGVPERRDTR
jgi:hypothetical protein